jgi:hypothetical protein
MSKLPLMFQEALTEFTERECDSVHVRDYSGRAMYGRKCLAVTGSHSDCMKAIAYAINAVHDTIVEWELQQQLADADPHEESEHAIADPDIDFADFVQTAMDFRQDSMGLDVVIYWERTEYVDNESDEDDDGDGE